MTNIVTAYKNIVYYNYLWFKYIRGATGYGTEYVSLLSVTVYLFLNVFSLFNLINYYLNIHLVADNVVLAILILIIIFSFNYYFNIKIGLLEQIISENTTLNERINRRRILLVISYHIFTLVFFVASVFLSY